MDFNIPNTKQVPDIISDLNIYRVEGIIFISRNNLSSFFKQG